MSEIEEMIRQELAKAGTVNRAEQERREKLERLEKHRITTETDIPKRQFLFRLFNIPCFPRGELVGLTGKEKSGKTYFTSLLMTLCQRREALNMERNVEEKLNVLWYDTEQSEESTQEILKDRIVPLINRDPEEDEFGQQEENQYFNVFNVRAESWEERLPFLEAAIEEYHPDLVVLDGIRDLVQDINDGVVAQAVIEKLMHLASDANCCMVCVLHQNKASEDKNPRGWIGTELVNKCFELWELYKDIERKVFVARQTRTRKFDIYNPLEFEVDEQGLPRLKNPLVEGDDKNNAMNRKYVIWRDQKNYEFDLKLLFGDALPIAGKRYSYDDVKREVMYLGWIKAPKYFEKQLELALFRGIVVRDVNGTFYRPMQVAEETDNKPEEKDLFSDSSEKAPF